MDYSWITGACHYTRLYLDKALVEGATRQTGKKYARKILENYSIVTYMILKFHLTLWYIWHSIKKQNQSRSLHLWKERTYEKTGSYWEARPREKSWSKIVKYANKYIYVGNTSTIFFTSVFLQYWRSIVYKLELGPDPGPKKKQIP